MAIQSIVDGNDLRKYGDILDRGGIAKRVIELCKIVAENENYKESIEIAGQIRALAMACKSDSYWCEKMNRGYEKELHNARKTIRENEQTNK